MVRLQGKKGSLAAYLPNQRLLKMAGFIAPLSGWF